MAQASQLSTSPRGAAPSSAAGGDMCLPDPTGSNIFTLGWHRLIQRRLNALINMSANPDPKGGSLVVSDANSVLPIPGGAGGGGGTGGTSLTKMQIVSVQGDYLVCTDTGGNNFNIAKPPLLRFSMTSRTINGYNYTYTYSLPNSRSISGTTNPGVFAVAEIIEPEYLVGDIIYAQNADHTDVFVSGLELPLIDMNIDQRGWVMEYGQ